MSDFDILGAWDEYHRRMSSLTAEMIGAADYLDAHPDYATDATTAAVFRRYAERMRAVPVPVQRGMVSK